MLLHAGPEIAVASTKAYTAQIAALAFLAKAVGKPMAMRRPKPLIWCTNCLSLPNRSNQPFQKRSDRRKVCGLLETTRNAFYIGRGQDYYVAMEASLKLKEISYIQCEGFCCG